MILIRYLKKLQKDENLQNLSCVSITTVKNGFIIKFPLASSHLKNNLKNLVIRLFRKRQLIAQKRKLNARVVRAIHLNISENKSVHVFLNLQKSELFKQYDERKAGSIY